MLGAQAQDFIHFDLGDSVFLVCVSIHGNTTYQTDYARCGFACHHLCKLYKNMQVELVRMFQNLA